MVNGAIKTPCNLIKFERDKNSLKILGRSRGDGIGEWRMLYHEEIHSFIRTPNIDRITK